MSARGTPRSPNPRSPQNPPSRRGGRSGAPPVRVYWCDGEGAVTCTDKSCPTMLTNNTPGFFPKAPESLEAAGLSAAFVEDHILRHLHAKPQSSGAQIAAACGLSFQSGISAVLDGLRKEHLVEIRGQRGIGDAGYAYVLTSAGAARALEDR